MYMYVAIGDIRRNYPRSTPQRHVAVQSIASAGHVDSRPSVTLQPIRIRCRWWDRGDLPATLHCRSAGSSRVEPSSHSCWTRTVILIQNPTAIILILDVLMIITILIPIGEQSKKRLRIFFKCSRQTSEVRKNWKHLLLTSDHAINIMNFSTFIYTEFPWSGMSAITIDREV